MQQPNLQAIIIANLIGIIILFITVVDNAWRFRTRALQDRLLTLMVLTCFTCCITDPASYILNGKPGNAVYVILIGCNIWMFIMCTLINDLLITFLLHYLGMTISKIHKCFLYLLSCIAMALIVINFFTPVLFEISKGDNIYSRGPLFLAYGLMHIFFLIDAGLIYFTARRKSGMLKFFPVWTLIGPVISGSLIQYFFTGVSTLWPFICISLGGIMFGLQNDLLFRDKLTSLNNRFYLDYLISNRSLTAPDAFSLMMLDLNDFKSINDRFGHTVGDQALSDAANAFTRSVNSLGEVIRYAGDEFIVILHTQDPLLINGILQAIRNNLAVVSASDRPYTLSVSAGWSELDLRNHEMDEHLMHIDRLMYEDKKKYYATHDRCSSSPGHSSYDLLVKLEKDSITGLYNELFFFEYANRMLSVEGNESFDMICIEIESYNILRGRYGDAFCQNMISSLSDTLMLYLPEDFIMGRIGDDCIGLLMSHISMEKLKQIIDNVVLRKQKKHDFVSSFKCGVYSRIDDNCSAESAFRNARAVCESIRYEPDHIVAQFDNELSDKLKRKKLLENNMHTALVNRQFQVFYQPQYQLGDGRIRGAEALTRWFHPKYGAVMPSEFIPLFEQNGFIYMLDKYVLNQVCTDMRQLIDNEYDVVPVSVNISQSDFDKSNLADTLERIVDNHNIPHELIIFEITESVDARDHRKMLIILNQLQNKGFSISLDDFGSGYSTLNALGDMPIDVIKLDKSIVQNIRNSKYLAILQGSLFVANKLDIPAIVEGVDSEDQMSYLKEICSGKMDLYVQGFLFSEPMQFEDLSLRIAEQSTRYYY
ncbi:MAG: EAL domain-containing protein [Parasporobacterium sp.]|nr:EAL domain-containing protein [Parasporobacterium sp.]